MTQRWQLAGGGPQEYERFLVPAFFAACAEHLVSAAGVAPGERVLDVACGTGIVARQAAELVGPGGGVHGVDLNPTMLDVAAGADPAGRVQWRVADAAALPYEDGAFDVACCQQGLQFFPDQGRILAEFHRVLRARGRVALAVWRDIAHNPAFVTLVELLGRHVSPAAGDIMRAPFAGPGREALHELLTGAGFQDITVRIAILTVRFPSAREFLRREAVSSPLAEPVGALDPAALDRLLVGLDDHLSTYADDEGLLFPMQTLIATAHRP